jgi:hypothetical protein
VPHPSGYPTYCLLGRAYALLPLGPIARRFNLFSATAAAASASLVYLCAMRVLRRMHKEVDWQNAAIAFLTATTWITGHTLWSQATITEVYALHAFFSTLCLYMVLRDDLLVRSHHWFLFGLFLGLGLGVHLTLVLMLPAMSLLLWPHVKWRRALALGVGLMAGLSVYLYLPLAASHNPLVNWGNPSSWEGFWWLVSGAPYRRYVLALPLSDLPSRLGAWLQLWGKQYTWLGLALALSGLWSLVERGERRLLAATGIIFVAYTVYAITYNTTDSYVYLLPAHMVTVLWMAEGAKSLLPASPPHATSSKLHVALVWALLLIIPVWSGVSHYGALSLRHEHTAQRWVSQTLDVLPRRALLITGQDRHTFALDHVLWVEGRRQDLLVMDGELLPYPWYAQQLRSRYGIMFEPSASLQNVIDDHLGRRPVYLSTDRQQLRTDYQIERHGVLWKVTGQKTSGDNEG